MRRPLGTTSWSIVMKRKTDTEVWGLLAEFEGPEQIMKAAKALKEDDKVEAVEAYTPYPMEELSHQLGHHKSHLPLLVLIGGLVGCVGGFGLQYWASVIAYPINVGGRPLNSWPAFIIPTFETTILLAAFAAVFGMLALNGLPMPYHPVFNSEKFRRASRDRYFLAISSLDPDYDPDRMGARMLELGALNAEEVEW